MTKRRHVGRFIGVVGLALISFTACGDDDGSGVPEDLAIVLQGDVDAIWQAAVSGDADAAVARLEELRGLVLAAQDDGTLPADAATRILVAADTVQARLGLLSAPPTTVPASDTTADAPATDGDDGDDDGDGDEGSDESDTTEAPESTEADTSVPDTGADTTVPDTDPDDGGPDTAPDTAPPDTDPPGTSEATPPATGADG